MVRAENMRISGYLGNTEVHLFIPQVGVGDGGGWSGSFSEEMSKLSLSEAT